MNDVKNRPNPSTNNFYFESEADEIMFLMELDELVIGSGRKLTSQVTRQTRCLENTDSLKG